MYIYNRQSFGPRQRKSQLITSQHSRLANVYLRPSETLGLIAAPKDQRAAQEKKVSVTITKAIAVMKDATRFLQSESQRDLLAVMLEILSTFFPTGHGLIDEHGKVTRNSKRHQIEASIRHPGEPISRPFMYEVQLFLSHQKSDFAAGDHRRLLQLRSLIRLYVNRLAGRTVNELGGVAIHELVRMMVALRHSLEARAGKDAAALFPTKKIAALSDLGRFAGSRKVLEQHFSILLDYLRREHGIDVLSSVLDQSAASLIAGMAVEEVLAHVYRKRVSIAIAEVEAERAAARTERSAVAIAVGFVPLQFLKNYLRHHWIGSLKDSNALKTPRAEQILKNMGTDLLKLVSAMESHLAA